MRTTYRRHRGVREEEESTFRDQEQGNRCRLRARTTKSDREEGD